MTAKEMNKLLRGKRIVSVRLRPFGETSAGTKAYDPEIILDDGSKIRFLAQETEADYGVELVIVTPATSTRKA